MGQGAGSSFCNCFVNRKGFLEKLVLFLEEKLIYAIIISYLFPCLIEYYIKNGMFFAIIKCAVYIRLALIIAFNLSSRAKLNYEGITDTLLFCLYNTYGL